MTGLMEERRAMDVSNTTDMISLKTLLDELLMD